MTKTLAWWLLPLNLLVLGLSWHWLPDPVASHFRGDGVANGWMSRSGHVLFMGVFIILMMVLFLCLPRLVSDRRYERWLSLPDRDHWLDPRHRPLLADIMASFSHRCGIAMGLFLLALQVMILDANSRTPAHLDNSLMLTTTGLFVAALLLFSIALVRRLRRP